MFHAWLSCPNCYCFDGDVVEYLNYSPPNSLLCIVNPMNDDGDYNDRHLNAFAVVVVVDIEIFFVLNCGLKCHKVKIYF